MKKNFITPSRNTAEKRQRVQKTANFLPLEKDHFLILPLIELVKLKKTS